MIAKAERLDPTRTLTLRKQFQTELRKRFVRLKGLIIRLVVDEDAFGLKGRNSPAVFNRRWAFETDSQKTQDFIEWLRTQIDAELLPVNATDQDYWRAFIQQGYEKGAGRAFDQVRRPFAESGNVSDFYNGTRQEFLRSAFASPASQDKLRQLVNRTYLDLVNTTQAMATQTGRALADGLARGENPWTIARELNKVVDKGMNNSLRVARTEIIRAHAEGSLDSMESLGVEEVGVAVEWSTAGDDRVCPRCAPMEGVVFKIKEARGLIPLHPNCRCSLLPANVGESTADQIRSKKGIEEAIDKSVEAEFAHKDWTLEQKRAASRWGGAGLKPDVSRPKSILDDVTPRQTPQPVRPTVQPRQQSQRPSPAPRVPRTPRPTARKRPSPKPAITKEIPVKDVPDLSIEARIKDVSEKNNFNRAREEILKEIGDKPQRVQSLVAEKERIQQKQVELFRKYNATKDETVKNDLLKQMKSTVPDLNKTEAAIESEKAAIRKSFLDKVGLNSQDRMRISGVNGTGGVKEELRAAKLSAKYNKKASEAEDFISSMLKRGADDVSPSELKYSKYQLKKNNRGFHYKRGVYLEEDALVDSFVHELGHSVEESMPGFKESVNEFLEMRFRRAGTQTVKMKDLYPDLGYGDKEFGNKDSLAKVFGERNAHYAGMINSNGTTELLSMSLEQLYDDPVKMIENDPELFDFVVGLMRGLL